MSYKFLLQTLLLLVIILTSCICVIKPKMHKTVMVYDSAYVLAPSEEVKVEIQNTPIFEQPAEPQVEKQEIVKNTDIETIKYQPQTIKYSEPKTNVSQQKITFNTSKTTPQKVTVKNETNKVQTQKINTEKIIANNKAYTTAQTQLQKEQTPSDNQIVQQNVTQKAPMPVKTVTSNTTSRSMNTVEKQIPSKKILTAREEEIAWNIWRSNLTNYIMKNSKLPNLQNGIIFRFSFTVDKFGKVTKVQTWSDDSKYTPYAVQFISPVIRNCQGRSILNFPEGSNRTFTDVTGAWKLSTVGKYSTPQDYNDIEVISK